MFNSSLTRALATGELPVGTLAAGRAATPPGPSPLPAPGLSGSKSAFRAKFGSKYFPKRSAKKSPRCFLCHGNEPRSDLKHSYHGGSRGAPGTREPGSPASCGVRALPHPLTRRVRANPGWLGAGGVGGGQEARKEQAHTGVGWCFYYVRNYESPPTIPSKFTL